MKRLAAGGAAALVTVATVGVIAASTGTAQQPAGRTIKLTEREVSSAFVDNPPRTKRCKRCDLRPSAGDAIVFTQKMSDEVAKRVGTLHGLCTFTRGGTFATGSAQCNLTLHLADGTLAMSALASFGNKTTPFSIIGGTGAYEGARGSGTSTERSTNSNVSDDVFHLLP